MDISMQVFFLEFLTINSFFLVMARNGRTLNISCFAFKFGINTC